MLNKVDYIIHDPRWNEHPIDMKSLIDSICTHFSMDEISSFSLLLTDDKETQELNKRYREQDKPTNVLSFPCADIKDYLGDLVLSFDRIETESKEQEKRFQDHAIHMVIHGVLHLLGYDHVEESQADEMEAHEVKILTSLNIKNPYDE